MRHGQIGLQLDTTRRLATFGLQGAARRYRPVVALPRVADGLILPPAAGVDGPERGPIHARGSGDDEQADDDRGGDSDDRRSQLTWHVAQPRSSGDIGQSENE
jgi:hypothetical protein